MNPITRSHLSPKERETIARIHWLLNQPGLLRASLVLTQRTCGRDYCRCRKSKKARHPCYYISQSAKGRPRLKFVPRDQERLVRSWTERYRQIKKLLDAVSDIYWEALKKGR